MSEEMTLNEGNSSSSDYMDGGVIPTVDIFSRPSEVSAQQGQSQGAAQSTDPKEDEKAKAAEQETPAADNTDDEAVPVRYDKDPAWQRIKSQRDKFKSESQELYERAVRAEAERDAYLKRFEQSNYQPKAKDTAAQHKATFFDMPEDQMLDKFNENPKVFMTDLRQSIRDELLEEVRADLGGHFQQQQYQKEVDSQFDAFDKAQGGKFYEHWDSGAVHKKMKENPTLYNPLAAYYEIRLNEIEEAHQEAISKATKEAEERVIAQFKAKRNAVTIPASASTGSTSRQIADELINPEKYGGATSVLATRMAARLRSRGLA